jgi:hypothetical protein
LDLKRDEVSGDWTELHNELHYLHSSPHIIMMIKSRSMRWAEHVAHMVEIRKAHRVLLEKYKGKSPFETLRSRW